MKKTVILLLVFVLSVCTLFAEEAETEQKKVKKDDKGIEVVIPASYTMSTETGNGAFSLNKRIAFYVTSCADRNGFGWGSDCYASFNLGALNLASISTSFAYDCYFKYRFGFFEAFKQDVGVGIGLGIVHTFVAEPDTFLRAFLYTSSFLFIDENSYFVLTVMMSNLGTTGITFTPRIGLGYPLEQKKK